MKESEFQVGDKVVCILDQRFKGTIKYIHEKTGFAYQYELVFDKDVPSNSPGAIFLYWQLKKIEDVKECWINIMPVIVWRVVPNISGHHYLKGHYKNEAICYFKINEIVLYDEARNDYKIKKSRDGDCFTILKKDC